MFRLVLWRGAAAFAAFFLAAAAAFAAGPGPLVTPEWVAEHACDDGIAVLDLRASKRAFERGHIACSVHSAYPRDGWRTVRDGLPGMLPETAALEALIGGLGIGNGDRVVVVGPGGSAGAATVATRVYWTFKVLGHDAVSVLDGGFAAFRADRTLPLDKGAGVARAPRTFAAVLRTGLLATAADVAEAGAAGTPLIDSRPSDYFVGLNKRGAVKRAGTLPGAENVPLTWLTTPDGRFQSPDVLERIAERTALDGDTPLIAFCNSGQMASLDWFVAHELLGNEGARMYDGSLIEWTADPANPVEQHFGAE